MFGGAASSLLAGLFDGPPARLVEVARTRVSVHYETGDPAVPMLSMCTPSAVRLPNSFVTDVLPRPNEALLNTERGASQHRTKRFSTGGGAVTIGDGLLVTTTGRWRVTRWWLPPRPRGLTPPSNGVIGGVIRQPLGRLDGGEVTHSSTSGSTSGSTSPWCGVPTLHPSYDGLDPAALIGAGPGLTPAGDDLIAGALVAAHATADPRLTSWQLCVRQLLTTGRTTAVSRAILHCALDGYATSELAEYVQALCGVSDSTRHNLERATTNLLAVGHSSGAALMTGVLHTLSTARMRGAL